MKEFIEKAEHIVIFTHMAPDGDAMGSSLAIWNHIKGQSDQGQSTKDVTVMTPNAFPACFSWMPGSEGVLAYEKNQQVCDEKIAQADLIICTDFNDPKRIGPMGEKMTANPCPKILIDHHLMDERPQRLLDEGYWSEVHSHPEACSACEIVYKLLTSEGLSRLTNEIANCIYTGLMTDTGNFSYNSNNPELYLIIAELLRAGVHKDVIYDAVFNQYSVERMRMTGFALFRKMRIFPEYHLALITLTSEELDRYHYQQGDCEGLVNMPLQIADVWYSVLMREEKPKPGTPKPRIRISFRSQGDRPVNIWARDVFHGGGHANASGGEIYGKLGEAISMFERTYKKYLKI